MNFRYLGLGLVSGAALSFEIVLTRVFAIAQGYHFGFLVISLALLGFGASGTALALLQARGRQLSGGTLPLLSALLALSLPAGYLIADYVPFDPYRLAWDLEQYFFFAVYLLSFAVPFFIAGAVQGLALTVWSERASAVYAANLVGSGFGCLLALAALSVTTTERCILVSAIVAAGGTLAFGLGPRLRSVAPSQRHRRRWAASAFLIVAVMLLIWHVPAWFDLRLSPYKPLEQILNYPDARTVAQRSNAFSRVDVVESGNLRSAPGLSLAFDGRFPRQTGLVVDADNVYTLTPRAEVSPALIEALPVALPFQMRPGARVLVLEPGGGLDVWVALHYQADPVTVVERNPAVVESIREREGNPYLEPGVRVVTAEPRGFLARSPDRFTVVDLALTANFRAVTAGAFTLSEDYSHTVEAFRSCLDHLEPGGLFVIHRWLQLPPTEELRAAALAVEALRENGVTETARHLVALRTFNTMLLVVKNEPFEPAEIEMFKSFARERQFDLVHYPGIRPDETNRFNKLPRDVYYESVREVLEAPARLYAASEYDVEPPRDDHPFFFHFFRWRQLPTLVALLGKTWQPFGGTGYLILLGLLAGVCLIALVFILLPLLVTWRDRRRVPGVARWRALTYFAALGLGFLFVEVPLIQRFILLLAHPVYAFTVVLFGLLVFSGVGSLLANRVPWRPALFLLFIVIVTYALLLDRVIGRALAYDSAWRVAIALLLLAPPGFLLGIPFPRGISALSAPARPWIALAWGVNGFTSTLSSILATLIALSWGFSWVLIAGALVYAVALALASFSVSRATG